MRRLPDRRRNFIVKPEIGVLVRGTKVGIVRVFYQLFWLCGNISIR
jgi:hypothetical protein